ncbi:MAG: A24 family peptidase [Pseudomonadota bacterium]
MELLHYLEATPTAFVIVAFLFGLLVGSFLNVVILRLPVMLDRQWHSQCRDFLKLPQDEKPREKFNLILPASRCPHCGHLIRAYENIPVLSYLFLRGKCAGCGSGISLRYPIIELATAILTAVTAAHFGFGWQAVFAVMLTWSLIALAVIDFDTTLLPDAITLPMLWLGLLLSIFGLFVAPSAAIIGAAAGYLALWSVYWLFKLLTGKEGMGYGDFKLLGMLGAWLGWKMLPVVILLSSLVGAIVGIALIVFRGRDRSIPIPFGPYLAAAGWLALLWGEDVIQLYFQFAGIH